jgi:hypothetical protein
MNITSFFLDLARAKIDMNESSVLDLARARRDMNESSVLDLARARTEMNQVCEQGGAPGRSRRTP